MSDYENQGLRRHHAVMRKIALGIVLAVAFAALIYDYAIARPSVEQAYHQIATQSQEAHRSADSPFTNEDVRALLGKPPSRIFRDGGDQVEVFSWIAGFPLLTHDLYVVFRENEQSIIYQRHSKFVYESEASIRGPLPEKIENVDDQGELATAP